MKVATNEGQWITSAGSEYEIELLKSWTYYSVLFQMKTFHSTCLPSSCVGPNVQQCVAANKVDCFGVCGEHWVVHSKLTGVRERQTGQSRRFKRLPLVIRSDANRAKTLHRASYPGFFSHRDSSALSTYSQKTHYDTWFGGVNGCFLTICNHDDKNSIHTRDADSTFSRRIGWWEVVSSRANVESRIQLERSSWTSTRQGNIYGRGERFAPRCLLCYVESTEVLLQCMATDVALVPVWRRRINACSTNLIPQTNSIRSRRISCELNSTFVRRLTQASVHQYEPLSPVVCH